MARLLFFVFGSGFAALIYQSAWQRLFRLVFGASTGASAVVFAVFLGGLGVGGAWLGRRAERAERPLVLYARLELGVAALAALSPLLLQACSRLYLAAGGQVELGWAATPLRASIALLVMGPAAVLMGGTLPAIARAAEPEGEQGRRRLAQLYAVNTLGAVGGTCWATFASFEVLGTQNSLLIAALLNALVGVAAQARGRALGSLAPAPPAVAEWTASQVAPRLVYAAAFALGFAFLFLELIWYRMLSPILGGSTYTFGLILAVALAGIALGGWLNAAHEAARRPTATLFAATAALEALAVALPLALGDDLAVLTAYLRGLGAMGFSALVAAWTVTTTLVVFPAALISGYQFPLLFGLLGRGRAGVARQVGMAYAANTGGCILGSLAGGFWLLPALSAVGAWRAVAALLLLLAVLALLLERGGRARLSAVCAMGAAVLCVFALLAPGPSAAWRHSEIGGGHSRLLAGDRNALEQAKTMYRRAVVWERDGVESSIALLAFGSDALYVNGKSDGSASPDRGTQSMLAMLPVFLHPAPRAVYVLGLGSGMSAGFPAVVPGVERVDVGELEPLVLDFARDGALANRSVLEQPVVQVHLGDAREYLLTTRQSYDVVASEPSNPYRAGTASLFTLEFYRAVEQRLRPGGLFAQWIQGYDIDAATIRVALKTMKQVFPVVEAWQTQPFDLLLIASREPQRWDTARLRRRAAEEPFQSTFRRHWLVDDLEGVLAHFVASDALLQRIVEAAPEPPNTDDQNLMEFMFARNVGRARLQPVTALLSRSLAEGAARPALEGPVDQARVEELRPRSWLINGDAAPPLPMSDPGARQRAQAVGLACRMSGLESALPAWGRQPVEPAGVLESYLMAHALAARGSTRALGWAGELEGMGFRAEALHARARLAESTGERGAALELLLEAVREMRRVALPLCGTDLKVLFALESVALGDPAQAARAARVLLEGPLAVHAQEPARQDSLQRLAFASRDPALCVEALGAHLEAPEWSEWRLEGRARCLAVAGHPLAERAAAELAAHRAAGPGGF